MIEVKEGNVIDALLNKEVDYIVHCCNSKGKFNSGVAKEVRERVPSAYRAYMYDYERCNNTLGTLSLSQNTPTSGVINLVGQEFYGYGGKRYGNYGAIAAGLGDIFHLLQDYDSRQSKNITIGIPYKFASDRAGCEWEIIVELIDHMLVPFVKDVVFYKL